MEKPTIHFSERDPDNELARILAQHPTLLNKILFNLLKRGDEAISDAVGGNIGEGNAAKVFFIGRNPGYCVKIMKPDMNKDFVKIPLEMEFELQDEAYYLSEKPFVPKPKVWSEDDGSGKETELLIMERVIGPSLQDVLEKKVPLPESFDFQLFFSELRRQIDLLHEHNIHHRDLHEGNVMIDQESGEPRVIDFGTAYKTWGEDDDPYVFHGLGNTTRKVRSDMSSIKLLKDLMTKYCQSEGLVV